MAGTVREIMEADVPFVTPEATMEDVLGVGVVTRLDVLDALTAEEPA